MREISVSNWKSIRALVLALVCVLALPGACAVADVLDDYPTSASLIVGKQYADNQDYLQFNGARVYYPEGHLVEDVKIVANGDRIIAHINAWQTSPSTQYIDIISTSNPSKRVRIFDTELGEHGLVRLALSNGVISISDDGYRVATPGAVIEIPDLDSAPTIVPTGGNTVISSMSGDGKKFVGLDYSQDPYQVKVSSISAEPGTTSPPLQFSQLVLPEPLTPHEGETYHPPNAPIIANDGTIGLTRYHRPEGASFTHEEAWVVRQGQATQLQTSEPSDHLHQLLYMSSDGNRAIVFRHSPPNNGFDLVQTQSTTATQVLKTFNAQFHPELGIEAWHKAWLSPDGRYVLLVGDQQGALRTFKYDSVRDTLSEEGVVPWYVFRDDALAGARYFGGAITGVFGYVDPLTDGLSLADSSDASFHAAEGCESGQCDTVMDRTGREQGLPQMRDPNETRAAPNYPKAACDGAPRRTNGGLVGPNVNLNSGKVLLRNVDLGWQARGRPFQIERSFNPAGIGNGELGKGWTHGFERKLVTRSDGGLLETDARGVSLALQKKGAGWEAPGTPVTARRAGTSVDVIYGTGMVYRYDAAGKLQQFADFNGNTTSFTYGPSGNTSQVTDPSGRVTDFEVVGGLLRSVTSPNGQRIQFAYSAAGRLAAVTDARNGITAYTYDDARGSLLSVMNPSGDRVQYEYDPSDLTRVATMREFAADGRESTSRLEYPSTSTRRFTDPLGAVTEYQLDEHGREVMRLDPLGQTIVTERQGGFVVASSNPYVGKSWLRDGHFLTGESSYGIPRQIIRTYEPGDASPSPYVPPGTTSTSFGSLSGIQFPLGTLDGSMRLSVHTYDDRGNLTSIADPFNQKTTIERRDDGQPSRIIDPQGRVTATFSYNERGDALSVTNADGKTTVFQRDEIGRLTSTTSPGNRTTSLTYEGSGWLRSTLTNALSQTTSMQYDANGRLNSVTKPSGRTVSFTNDRIHGRDLVTSVTGSDGAITRANYDANGQLASIVDPLNRVTTYSRDALGRTTGVAYSDGTTMAVRYDANNGVTALVNERGATTTFQNDVHRRPNFAVAPDGSYSQFYYDVTFGTADYVIHPDFNGEISIRDANGNLVASYDPMYAIRRFEYSPTNKLTRSIDARHESTRYFYDDLDRLIRARDPLDRNTRYSYGPDDELRRVETPGGAEWRYTHDPLLRVRKVENPLGGETVTQYDEDGRLSAVTNENGARWSFDYDTAGRLFRERDPDGRVVTHHYNVAGEEVRRVFADGSVHRFFHDARGRITQRRMKRPDHTLEEVETFTYDAAGNRTSAENDAAKITSEYDVMNREVRRTTLFKATQATRTLVLTYDVMGRRQNLVDSHGRSIHYTYDANSRPTEITITEPSTWTTGLTAALSTRTYRLKWDAESNLTRVIHPNKTRVINAYDASGQLESKSHFFGTNDEPQVLASFAYQYDPEGRISRITRETGLGFEYSYDAAGRLINAKLPSDLAGRLRAADGTPPTAPDAAADYHIRRVLTGAEVSYEYDPAGNRTRVSSDGGLFDATYSASNRLLTQGALTYGYDDRGFQTSATYPSGALRLFDYDGAGHLASIRTGPSSSALTTIQQNAYDANARRVSQWDVATNRTTNTLWDGLTPIDTFWAGPTAGTERGIAMFDGGGASEQRPYVWTSVGTRAPINADGWTEYTGVNSKSQFEWMLPDHLGTPAVLANFQGGVTGTMAHGAWGEELEGSFARTSMTYAATQRNTGTGLQYAWNRWYDPRQGRFLSRDPIGFEGGDLNLYRYAGGNPVSFVDPTGLDFYVRAGVGDEIVGGVDMNLNRVESALNFVLKGKTVKFSDSTEMLGKYRVWKLEGLVDSQMNFRAAANLKDCEKKLSNEVVDLLQKLLGDHAHSQIIFPVTTRNEQMQTGNGGFTLPWVDKEQSVAFEGPTFGHKLSAGTSVDFNSSNNYDVYDSAGNKLEDPAYMRLLHEMGHGVLLFEGKETFPPDHRPAIGLENRFRQHVPGMGLRGN